MKPDLKSKCRVILHFVVAVCSATGLDRPFSGADEISLDEESPRTVYVVADGAEIRSGPSSSDYPTQLADRGSPLEAYDITPDGWLAIRPPAGSFSWVPASQAYLLPGGRVIEITDKQAVSWIGTQLGTKHHYRWQVELNAGEQLRVLGEKTRVGTDGQDELWYRIAPPDGEFRWIHQADVTLTPPDDFPSRLDGDGNARSLASRTATIASSSTATTNHSASLAKRQTKVGTQARRTKTSGRAVRAAAYQDDVFGDGPAGPLRPVPEGQMMPGTMNPQMMTPGVMTPGVMTPGVMTSGQAPSMSSSNRFDGWSLWEFDDDGMHPTMLQKIIGARSSVPRTDPLAADPFDLSMSTPMNPGISSENLQIIQEQRMAGGPINYLESSPPAYARADRAWRDPRTLRQRRMSRAAANEGLARTPPGIIQSIRENVESLRRSISSSPNSRSAAEADPESAYADDWGDVEDLDVPPIEPFQNDESPGGTLVGRTRPSAEPGPMPETQWYGIDPDSSGSRSGKNDYLGEGDPGRGDAGPSYRSPSSAPSAGLPAAERGNPHKAVEHLKVALSEMVAQPPSLWNLERLARQTQHLIEHGSDPIERGQARLLLERIQEFEQHARRTAFAAPGALGSAAIRSAETGSSVIRSSYQDSSTTSRRPGVTSATFAARRDHKTSRDSRSPFPAKPYDATGWLVPVHSTTPGQPSHAITDDSGQILAYVTSRAGLNLDSYINQPVGIIGLRGYLTRLQAGHIQAQRIVALR